MKKILMLCLALALPTAAHAEGTRAQFAAAAKLLRAGDAAGAMAIWKPLAQAGDANAAFNLGVVFHHGDGVAVDKAEAARWYRVAAERGDRDAQSRLGAMYLNGEGVARSEEAGWRWINEHRVAHLHHHHHAHMLAWREQAAQLVWASDMREKIAAGRESSARILADLQRRAAGNTRLAGDTATLARAN